MEKRIMYKIYVTGEDKYIEDFLFLFPGLKAIIISDITSDFASREKAIIVICRKNSEKLVELYAEKGLVYGKDFIFASDFMTHWIEYEVLQRAHGKKIALWGIGHRGEEFFDNIKNLKIDCVLDKKAANNNLLWNGYNVFYPYDLKKDFWECHYIIITSDFYDELAEYLKENNCKEFIDFVSYKAFLTSHHRNIIDSIEGKKRTAFPCPAMNKHWGLFFSEFHPCMAPGWVFPIGDLTIDSMSNILNSVVYRAFKLSIKNCTNSFCNGRQCEFIFNKYFYEIKENAELFNSFPSISVVEGGYDDSCNLYCQTCRNKIISETSLEKDKLHEVFKSEFIPRCDMLYLAPMGEVFSSKYYRALLTDEILKDIRYLFIHSNGVLAKSDDIKHYCEIMDGVGIVFSVDAATDATYKEIRRGGNFSRLLKNMDKIGNLRASGILNAFSMVYVVSALNVKEMYHAVEIADRFNMDYVCFIMIDNWGLWTEEEYHRLNVADEKRKPGIELKEQLTLIENHKFKTKHFWDHEWEYLLGMMKLICK